MLIISVKIIFICFHIFLSPLNIEFNKVRPLRNFHKDILKDLSGEYIKPPLSVPKYNIVVLINQFSIKINGYELSMTSRVYTIMVTI